MEQSDHASNHGPEQSELWVGYDRLLIPFELISAVLVYQPVWDRRILHSFGTVPAGIRSVVLLHDGRVLPSSRALADLHGRWVGWQHAGRLAELEAPQDQPVTDDPQ